MENILGLFKILKYGLGALGLAALVSGDYHAQESTIHYLEGQIIREVYSPSTLYREEEGSYLIVLRTDYGKEIRVNIPPSMGIKAHNEFLNVGDCVRARTKKPSVGLLPLLNIYTEEGLLIQKRQCKD